MEVTSDKGKFLRPEKDTISSTLNSIRLEKNKKREKRIEKESNVGKYCSRRDGKDEEVKKMKDFLWP